MVTVFALDGWVHENHPFSGAVQIAHMHTHPCGAWSLKQQIPQCFWASACRREGTRGVFPCGHSEMVLGLWGGGCDYNPTGNHLSEGSSPLSRFPLRPGFPLNGCISIPFILYIPDLDALFNGKRKFFHCLRVCHD